MTTTWNIAVTVPLTFDLRVEERKNTNRQKLLSAKQRITGQIGRDYNAAKRQWLHTRTTTAAAKKPRVETLPAGI